MDGLHDTLSQRLDAMGEQERAAAHTRRGKRRLRAGVTPPTTITSKRVGNNIASLKNCAAQPSADHTAIHGAAEGASGLFHVKRSRDPCFTWNISSSSGGDRTRRFPDHEFQWQFDRRRCSTAQQEHQGLGGANADLFRGNAHAGQRWRGATRQQRVPETHERNLVANANAAGAAFAQGSHGQQVAPAKYRGRLFTFEQPAAGT
jgi:hypothetical protein